MKCETHNKHSILWWDPCVNKKVPNFWKRIDKIVWLIGIEASIASLNKIKIQQTKEKYGYTNIYYSCKYNCDFLKDKCFKILKKKQNPNKSHKIPKYILRAMERQRRLNPDIAHYIYDFSPYKCNCKNEFWCKEYENTTFIQKIWDRIIIKLLEFYGNHSSRWVMLKGGFVVYGRQWGYCSWQKAKRSFKRPF